MANSSGVSYAMGSTEPELERLIGQAHLFEAQSRSFLTRAGLGEGMRAADVGCGPLGVLDILRQMTGSSGEVAGIDASTDMIALAGRILTSQGIAGVRLAVAEAAATGLPSGHFDVVHERLLLTNVTNHADVVGEMVRITRPGGIVALHDVDAAAWFCEPPHPAWTRLADAFTQIFAARGDQHVGRKLPGLLRAADLRDVQVQAFTELWGPEDWYREKLIVFVQITREAITAAGILTDAEIDELITDLRAHLAQPGCLIFGGIHFQAWARKP
jgi:SAM-dependent methyltransferase